MTRRSVRDKGRLALRLTPSWLAVLWLAAFWLAAVGAPAMSQETRSQEASYLDYDSLSAQLTQLTSSSDAASLRSIGKSLEGRDLWLVEIGDRSGMALSDRPGLLVVANLEGDHVIGSGLAVETIRHLVNDESAAEVRANQVVYVVPRLNPDAAEAMFSGLRSDRRRNSRPYDDDNDGRIDEDPGEDLNGDGLVTVMRVADPEGGIRVDPDNERLMKPADPAQGEAGTHKLYWEGIDNDGDGFFNEDGLGGVDLNRNFQHAYPYWQADAGIHMVSEPETRALLDFVIEHRNIGAILSFGHSDNLSTPIGGDGKLTGFTQLELTELASASNQGVFEVGNFVEDGGRGGGRGFGFRFGGGGGGGLQLRGAQLGRNNDPSSGRRPETVVNEADRPYFQAVSEAYRETTGVTATTLRREPAGAFFEFGYFQFGVPSFSSPGWGFEPEDKPEEAPGDDGPPDSEAEEGAAEVRAEEASQGRPAVRPGRGGRGRGRGAPGGRGGGRRAGGGAGGADAESADGRILAGLEAAGIDGFVDWSEFQHPDLGMVEIGGFRPYVTTNPPAQRVTELGKKHGEFAVELASMLPRVRFVDSEVTSHGGGVFTVEAEIENSGFLPTSLEHGVVSRSVQPTTVQIQVDPAAVLTGSAKTSTVEKLAGSGGRASFTWVIRGEAGDSVEITVRAQKGGRDSTTVVLR